MNHLVHRLRVISALDDVPTVVGSVLGGGHMQPMQVLAHSQAAFLEVGYLAGDNHGSGPGIEHVQMLVSAAQDVVHCPFAEVDLEQIGLRLLESCVGQHLILTQIGHHALNFGAILHRLGDVLWKEGLAAALAIRTRLDLYAMFVRLYLEPREIETWRASKPSTGAALISNPQFEQVSGA